MIDRKKNAVVFFAGGTDIDRRFAAVASNFQARPHFAGLQRYIIKPHTFPRIQETFDFVKEPIKGKPIAIATNYILRDQAKYDAAIRPENNYLGEGYTYNLLNNNYLSIRRGDFSFLSGMLLLLCQYAIVLHPILKKAVFGIKKCLLALIH